MAKLKLRVTKAKNKQPVTKKMGYIARVLTNGTADYDDIAEDAAEDTTFNVDEIRASAGIFCRAAAKRLKQGFIVDLGPIGKLYPSCTSSWVEKEEDLKLSDVKPTLYFKPADEVAAAINSASLVWSKKEEEDEDDEGGDEPTPSPSPSPTPDPDDQGGGGGDDDHGDVNSATLAAPTISGNTTFSESTEVSISAADGAEIRYTLDGSTPTASSTLYSEPFTVTETTSVKAVAVKDGQTSEVASKTFVKSSGEGGMDQN